MTTYLLIHDGSFGALKITTHANRRDAFTYVNQLAMDRARYSAVEEPLDLPADDTIGLLSIAQSFGPKAAPEIISRETVYNLIVSKYHSQPHEVIAPPPVVTSLNVREERTMETAPAETPAKGKGKAATASKPAKKTDASVTKAAKTASAPKASRAKGKPAGAVADFVQIKDGSKRGEILKLMDGTHTMAEIGALLTKSMKVEVPTTLVSSNIFCLHRDCAIGHSLDKDGKVTALYPKGKSLTDAMKQVAAPVAKTPKATASPKSAPKAAAAPKADGVKKASTKKGTAPAAAGSGDAAAA